MTREEALFANDPGAQAKGYVFAAYSKVLPKPTTPTLQFEAKPCEIFDESADLYRDGSVVVVPLRGHTPGSIGIFVNLSPTRWFLYVGDSVDDGRGFENPAGKPLLPRDSDEDPVLANRIVSRLEPTPRNGSGAGDHSRPRPQRLQETLARRAAHLRFRPIPLAPGLKEGPEAPGEPISSSHPGISSPGTATALQSDSKDSSQPLQDKRGPAWPDCETMAPTVRRATACWRFS